VVSYFTVGLLERGAIPIEYSNRGPYKGETNANRENDWKKKEEE
jgi:hypothetical protein